MHPGSGIGPKRPVGQRVLEDGSCASLLGRASALAVAMQRLVDVTELERPALRSRRRSRMELLFDDTIVHNSYREALSGALRQTGVQMSHCSPSRHDPAKSR